MTDEKDNATPLLEPPTIKENACEVIGEFIKRNASDAEDLSSRYKGLNSYVTKQISLRDQLINSLTRSIEALEQLESGHKEEIKSLQQKVSNLELINPILEKENKAFLEQNKHLRERNTKLEDRLYSSFGWRLRKFFRRLKFWK